MANTRQTGTVESTDISQDHFLWLEEVTGDGPL